MKKLLLSAILLGAALLGYSQSEHQKAPSIGVHFFANDFLTAADLRQYGLSDVIKNRLYSKPKRLNPGLGVSYVNGITDHVDMIAMLSGSLVDYSIPGTGSDGEKQLLLEATAMANVKLLSDKYLINPYITAGVGAYQYKKTFGAFMPIGLGLQGRVTENIFLLLTTDYRVPVTDKAAYHLNHSIGIVTRIKKKEAPVVVAPPPPPVVLDKDGDGINDDKDECPDQAGLAILNGCPDKDGDGLADKNDKCPDVAGTAKYQGCPIPDTDGDGINDEQDQCPNEKGFARYQGCPIPDTDKDGVNDEEDKCPSRPGPATNMGCPEIPKAVIEKINVAAKNIFFATGSAKLLKKSFKSLDEVAGLLKADESLLIAIDGHTDSTGKREKNLALSSDRANAVKAYLATKGITENRMTATGYGPDKPVASNKKASGRALNRRVEMTVRNY
jgi:outer membrane protein OmpA-like peptidoglycan-associated protein